MDTYNSLLICSLVIFSYFVSYVLVQAGALKLISHKKFWNTILALSFVGSALLGIILAVLIDNKLSISWYRNMLWYHVEIGIVMATITIFHLLWHIRYYFPTSRK